ncbi:hypothetical protein CAPI_03090 [Corynebacterium capitovis DSM 44611]|nr:hypothetical protein CAPI_03090 [Corynebacterium capitovis DSM 44611]
MSSISPNRFEEVTGSTPVTRYCLTEKENNITLPKGAGEPYIAYGSAI